MKLVAIVKKKRQSHEVSRLTFERARTRDGRNTGGEDYEADEKIAAKEKRLQTV